MRIAVLSLTVFSLLQLSAAQPRHRHHHQRLAQRRSFNPKRDKVTVTDSAYTVPTEVAEVVLYVDQFGTPISTATETVVILPATHTSVSSIESSSTKSPPPPPPPPPHTETEAPSPSVPVAPVTTASTEVKSPPIPIPNPISSTVSTPTTSSNPSPPGNGASNLHGVTYSPYKGSGGCKSASEVAADFALFAESHGVVRLYGVDCDQVASAYPPAKKYGNKLFLGIFDITSVTEAVSTMAIGVNNDWGIVDTVSVGNELVNNGAASAADVLSAVAQARSLLRAAGYKGAVVTVDTFVAAIDHPELCNESDYCAVNVHPFFDPNTASDQAGSFVASTVERLRSQLSNPSQRIVVTETGWPWKGQANSAAIPGMDTQATAINSITSSFSSNPADCILFTAFNDLWKQPAAGTFYAEQFWGIGGRYSPADQ
ncbi:cell wall glucanase [Xylariales sp. AK1849]|nr:cell wall glucanase [Xylariales sp. AK1849]